MKPTVLVVDDDERFRERLARAFAARGWEASAAGSGQEALEVASRESPEHAVVDLRMPEMTGLETVRALLAIDPSTKIVLLTGFGSIATAVEAIREGAIDYLTKPAEIDEILRAFERRDRDAAPPDSVPSLARTEWEHINRVLAECNGNVSQAARLLGIHRRSLQRKLAKYPVRR
ncbi:MAG: response regulator [Sandaracinaceae bacterium]|nr:response regulator [Sandaracinaceae bacterium]